jgi:hypothetical protein
MTSPTTTKRRRRPKYAVGRTGPGSGGDGQQFTSLRDALDFVAYLLRQGVEVRVWRL